MQSSFFKEQCKISICPDCNWQHGVQEQSGCATPVCRFQRTAWAEGCTARPSSKACSYRVHAACCGGGGMLLHALISPDRTALPPGEFSIVSSTADCKSAQHTNMLTKHIHEQTCRRSRGRPHQSNKPECYSMAPLLRKVLPYRILKSDFVEHIKPAMKAATMRVSNAWVTRTCSLSTLTCRNASLPSLCTCLQSIGNARLLTRYRQQLRQQ